jgi:hypothetical protein
MFYALRLCANPDHERYMRPIEFIVEGEEYDEAPLERETEDEIRSELEGHMLYEAGWVEIIEID